MARNVIRAMLVVGLVMLAAMLFVSARPAYASTLTVTSLADSGPGSLRQAVIDANPGDTITFAVTGTITLTGGGISIGKNLTIQGPGAGALAVSGNNATSVFYVNCCTVEISGMTIRDGYDKYSGGISNYGTLSVTNTIFSANESRNEGGGIANEGGTLTVTNSTFIGNRGDYGGAIYSNGTLTVTGSRFSGNSAVTGGAIVSTGSGSVSASCITANTTSFATDMHASVGALSADGNWWGISTGPNTGGETTNIPVATFLTSAPPCGATSGGAGLCSDGRINCQMGDEYAPLYARQDPQGEPDLHVYCINAEGQGHLALIVTQDDLAPYPAEPEVNTNVATVGNAEGCLVPVSFWILTTGEYQVNIGPNWKGDVVAVVFSGLPPEDVYFHRINVLN